MADDSTIINNMNTKNGNFICGVVEGFYGRPWTSEQRKDLFQKLKKWGMNSYVYAPKDDSKHRANWRDLYTVEEADHLTSLIAAADECGITFYYALSPGLDMAYSSAKDVAALKRKLEQASQLGCTAFALLFDDIDPEMSEADKEVFQSFAHAQVSVTNDVYQHLNQPKFLVCPTQYCAARAVPNVTNSEYLSTLGSKLAPRIDIMWTGSKVISRVVSVESIEEVTEVLRRPPVIWDNLHANDYDQKRVFLGPYQGRSPDLIPRLRGVLTNPNCEFWANFVAIHTLAQWSVCLSDSSADRRTNQISLASHFQNPLQPNNVVSYLDNAENPLGVEITIIVNYCTTSDWMRVLWCVITRTYKDESVCSDIKLETEADDGSEIPTRLPVNMYHARRALRNAIIDWLPEFHRNRQASGFITKPEVVSMVPVPATVLAAAPQAPPIPVVVNTCIALTTTSSVSSIATSAPQLSALADVCTTVNGNAAPIVMNSLLSETKVCTEPMDCNATPPPEPAKSVTPEHQPECEPTVEERPESVEVNFDSDTNGGSKMIVDSTSPEPGNTEMSDWNGEQLTTEDITLLCDLFYLPFEHGTQGIQLLQEFHWLHSNAHLVATSTHTKPEVDEWHERAKKLEEMSENVNRLFHKLNGISNKELMYELYPYIWEIRAVISTLNSYIKWLGGGKIGQTTENPALGNYTWFSKGWKESFMSGEQEPWVFRGGLTADLQRLIPVDGGSDLFVYKVPQTVSNTIYTIREYTSEDDGQVLALRTTQQPSSNDPLDKLVECMLGLGPQLCFVVEEERGSSSTNSAEDKRIIGHAIALIDAQAAAVSASSQDITDDATRGDAEQVLSVAVAGGATKQHPSLVVCCVHPSITDQSVSKRLVICLLAALRANGSCGVYTPVRPTNTELLEFYSKLGFVELSRDATGSTVYLGRVF